MNSLQKCELEILLEIDRICMENNIQYFLSSGTLLGAIRHKGFIPWDDDVDIMMTADNYWRFSEIAPKTLGKDYFFQSSDTDLWYKAFAKVRKNHTTMIETSYENVRFHQGVWVDIFPIIGLKNEPKALNRINRIISWTDLLTQDAFFEKTENLSPKLKLIRTVPLSLRRFLCKRIRKKYFRLPPPDVPSCDYYWGFPMRSARFLLADFQDVICVPFEGHMLPVPKAYDRILTLEYGDYMTPPPEDKRNGGHFIATLDLENDYTKYIP